MNFEEKIIAIISENTEKDQEINLSKRLNDDLGIDSLDILMVVHGIEDEFNITIEDENFRDIITVGDIVDKLRQRYPEICDSSNGS